jgi:hypothetical protein
MLDRVARFAFVRVGPVDCSGPAACHRRSTEQGIDVLLNGRPLSRVWCHSRWAIVTGSRPVDFHHAAWSPLR